MSKSYRKIQFKRQKKNPQVNNHRKGSRYKKILRQLGLCIIIVLLVIVIKNINAPITNKAIDVIKTSLEEKTDVKRSLKQVIRYAKEIPQMPNKVVSVFNNFSNDKTEDMKFIVPLNGEIVSSYGENIDPILKTKTFQRGIDIVAKEDKNIVAIATGKVVEIGESDSLGKYVKIEHNSGVFSLYGNCSEIIINKGDKVKQGDIIASIGQNLENQNAYLHFELWIDGKVVDPMRYISFDKKIL
ncbi:M23 family metallopeptidase [Clostridiaceae bacterium 35-E11]